MLIKEDLGTKNNTVVSNCGFHEVLYLLGYPFDLFARFRLQKSGLVPFVINGTEDKFGEGVSDKKFCEDDT
jgi:hypothetical protein